mmetsp:Transcript_16209/g.48700  ORF Transcript_16209/g.48700 Transcript_16209/m.48700 type:complete len:222 (+) Transcript_16209:1142-1807(+)
MERLRDLLALQHVARVEVDRREPEDRGDRVRDPLQQVDLRLARVRPLRAQRLQEARGLRHEEGNVVEELRGRTREELLRRPLLVQGLQRNDLLQHELRAFHGVVAVLRGPLMERPILARGLRRLGRHHLGGASLVKLRSARNGPQLLRLRDLGYVARHERHALQHQLRGRADLQRRQGGELRAAGLRLLLDELRDSGDVLEGLLVERPEPVGLLVGDVALG